MANSFKITPVGRLTALKANQLAMDQNWTLDQIAYPRPTVSGLSEQFELSRRKMGVLGH